MHVLSTPPAFILSQDQTLRCRSIPLDLRSLHFRSASFHLRLICIHPRHALLSSPSVAAPSLTQRFRECYFNTISVAFQDLRSGSLSHPLLLSGLPGRENRSTTKQTMFQLCFLDGTSHLHCFFIEPARLAPLTFPPPVSIDTLGFLAWSYASRNTTQVRRSESVSS